MPVSTFWPALFIMLVLVGCGSARDPKRPATPPGEPASTEGDARAPGVQGSAFLGIRVDGVDRGSVGVQGIGAGNANSQRTLAASFLAAGPRRLAPGKHKIQVWARGKGQFVHLAASADMPLLFFD
jgi:hypothetical protein